jgi:diadenosine tetraphosphate (Ap4A) HIT family hydrolase
MDPDCHMCAFLQQKPLPNQILTTEHWSVGVISDQPYLGRAIISLNTHKGSLGQLSTAEWLDFQTVVQRLEPAYEKAFGAVPLNIGCFMNHAFRDDPPHPHVHWHVFPRYKQPVEFAGLVFEDNRYGEFYDNDAARPLSNDIVTQISEQLKAHL